MLMSRIRQVSQNVLHKFVQAVQAPWHFSVAAVGRDRDNEGFGVRLEKKRLIIERLIRDREYGDRFSVNTFRGDIFYPTLTAIWIGNPIFVSDGIESHEITPNSCRTKMYRMLT